MGCRHSTHPHQYTSGSFGMFGGPLCTTFLYICFLLATHSNVDLRSHYSIVQRKLLRWKYFSRDSACSRRGKKLILILFVCIKCKQLYGENQRFPCQRIVAVHCSHLCTRLHCNHSAQPWLVVVHHTRGHPNLYIRTPCRLPLCKWCRCAVVYPGRLNGQSTGYTNSTVLQYRLSVQ